MANMPTEEVFTVPLKTGVNGYVASTKPLSYGGNIIDNFTVTFENGRIVKVEAEQGQEVLENLSCYRRRLSLFRRSCTCTT